jgi:PAS domain S-box-containing protein
MVHLVMRADRKPLTRHRTWPILAVLVGIVASQVLVALISIEMLSAVRAYVGGESLYSKGQKDAQIHLLDYAQSHREEDYREFLQALEVPLGDRAAREALQLPDPDVETARKGFLLGANHPDDIDGLITLFRWFHRLPFMAAPIQTWTEGDLVIQEMRRLAESARARILAGDLQAPAIREMREQVPILNSRLTGLERRFSEQLGSVSRLTKRLLLTANLALALMLSLAGLVFVRQSMRALREGEKRLSRLVATVADGVIAVDSQQRIILFNGAAERMFHVRSEDLVGTPVEPFVDKHYRAEDRATVRDLLGGGGDAGTKGLRELVGVRADGEEFPIEASLSRLETAHELIVTIVFRDVSEQHAARKEREAREALEASNRAKTDFLSRVSHELRTPLNAVLGFAQLLRVDRRQALTPDQLDRVQHIERAGTHLLALVNDVLDLSRVESGQMMLSLEPVDARTIAEEAIAFVSPLAAEAGVTVDFAPAGAPRPLRPGAPRSYVMADRVRLRQSLMNLLSNAVKYNRPGGRVAFEHREHDGQSLFVVTDTGAGMQADQLARLFEPFNRLGAERSSIEGTGIGLVLSKNMIELMHGSLTIASTPGVGTTATVTLQQADAPAAPSPPPFVPSRHGVLEGSLTVLYAEDNEVNVELVRQLTAFRPAISLLVAPNGASALEMASREPPDLMLVDMHLGDMTGIELAHQLRRRPATAEVPLVALSADALPEQISAALEQGFEGYLTKPVNFRELLKVIDRHTV